MALSCMIRKTSHGVVPLALRAMACPRLLTGSVNANALIGEEHGFNAHRSYQYFSTSANAHKLADKEFLEFLKSEIKSAKTLDSDIQVPQAPAHFPFYIGDVPGEAKIILSRRLDGEDIHVEVDGPHKNTKDNNDVVTEGDNSSSTDFGDDDDDDDDNVNSSSTESSSDSSDKEEEEQVAERRKFNFLEPRINIRVTIIKEYKYTTKLLECLVWANNGSILVRDIYLDPESPDQFCGPPWILEGSRQDYWRDYLAARGIEGGIVDFLLEYMVKKNKRDDLLFLKKLGHFVRKRRIFNCSSFYC